MNHDLNKLLEDVKELIQIPDIFNSLFHKIEELKKLYEDNIDFYRKLGLIETKASPPSFYGLPFKITRKGKQWETSIDIPQPIIDYIVNSDIKPGIPIMKRRLQFPDLSRRYTLTFEKNNSSHITGMIKVEKDERKEKPATAPAAPASGSHLKVLRAEGTHKDEEFRDFLFYMTTNKGLYEHVMGEFRIRWKPAIDSQFFNGDITVK